MRRQQVGDQQPVDGHPGQVTLDDPDIGKIHFSESAVAKHHFLEADRALALLLALGVGRGADVPERSAAHLGRADRHIAQVDVVKTGIAQIDVIKVSPCQIHGVEL